MYTVENLAPQDFTWAIEVAGKNMISQEVGRPDLYNREQFIRLTNIMMKDGTVLIAKKDGRPIGVIGGIVGPNTYNPKITNLAEILWYVLPQHRGGRAGVLLIKAFKDVADKVADESTLSTLSTSQVNDASLEKMGWKFVEKGFHYYCGKEK